MGRQGGGKLITRPGGSRRLGQQLKTKEGSRLWACPSRGVTHGTKKLAKGDEGQVSPLPDREDAGWSNDSESRRRANCPTFRGSHEQRQMRAARVTIATWSMY